ncbi:glycoside hydrolase domain-containing protein, partial [Weissella paramesenteroides]
PYTSIADLTVIKGLLTSNGNVNRDASAMDTSKQLTANDVNYLKSQGYKIIGRYLTGSVGDGAAERNKYLTRTELHDIISAGISVVPIYQDGGGVLGYFSESQGIKDANLAGQAARALGIPSGATIYFAADLDVEDGNIDATIIPYIKAVANQLSGYKVGIYGTRNVCSRAAAAGAVTSAYVADMSTGFSGNLGFPMPKVWAFDQFVEFTLGGIPIDNLGTSGRDKGIKEINNTISAKAALRKIIDNANLTLDGPKVVIVNGGGLHVTAQATSTVNSA